jgi:hypothetical protein
LRKHTFPLYGGNGDKTINEYFRGGEKQRTILSEFATTQDRKGGTDFSTNRFGADINSIFLLEEPLATWSFSKN